MVIVRLLLGENHRLRNELPCHAEPFFVALRRTVIQWLSSASSLRWPSAAAEMTPGVGLFVLPRQFGSMAAIGRERTLASSPGSASDPKRTSGNDAIGDCRRTKHEIACYKLRRSHRHKSRAPAKPSRADRRM